MPHRTGPERSQGLICQESTQTTRQMRVLPSAPGKLEFFAMCWHSFNRQTGSARPSLALSIGLKIISCWTDQFEAHAPWEKNRAQAVHFLTNCLIVSVKGCQEWFDQEPSLPKEAANCSTWSLPGSVPVQGRHVCNLSPSPAETRAAPGSALPCAEEGTWLFGHGSLLREGGGRPFTM